jgi:hypothetical protein
MKNDAIVNNDVSAEEVNAADEIQNQQPKYVPSDRDKAIAEIARQAEEHDGIERADEQDDQAGDLETGRADDKAAERQDQDDPLAALGYYKNAAGDLVTKIKVNGEEREIKADQLKAYLQKEMAGDLKLQQAHQREQELARKEQWIVGQEKRLKQTMNKQPSPEDAAATRLKVKDALEKMWDGDTDAATETLAELLQRGNATVDSDQIESLVERTTESAIEKREKQRQAKAWDDSVNEGNKALRRDHPEIYDDPRLFDMVNAETARMREDTSNSHLTPEEIIAKAADSVSQWLNDRKPGAEKPNSRQERKANLKPVVSGMNKVHRPAPKAEIDTSPLASIERMRAGRATGT